MDPNPYAPPESQVTDVAGGAGLPPGTRLYSPGQIFLASFLGGPFAGAWLFSRNYRAFDKDRSAAQSLWIGLGFTVALAAVSFVLPKNFPNLVLPLAYSFALRYYAKAIFGKSFDEHVAGGGEKGSWWTVVGVAVLCVAAFLALVFALVIAFPWIAPPGR